MIICTFCEFFYPHCMEKTFDSYSLASDDFTIFMCKLTFSLLKSVTLMSTERPDLQVKASSTKKNSISFIDEQNGMYESKIHDPL